MPIYEYKCIACEKIFEQIVGKYNETTVCDCGHLAERQFTPTKFIPFKPYIETNLGDEPIEIKSPKQLRKECNKVGADYV